MDRQRRNIEEADGHIAEGSSPAFQEVISRKQNELHSPQQGVQDARRQEKKDHVEKKSQQSDRSRIQEREEEAAAAAGEGEEGRIQDHLHRRDDVHEVRAADDGVLPAEVEREHRQVASL